MFPVINQYHNNIIPQNTIFNIAENKEDATYQGVEKNLRVDEINALYRLSGSTCLSELNEDDANVIIQYFQQYIPELSNKMNSKSLLLLIKKKAIKTADIPIEMQTNDVLMLCCQYNKNALKHIAKEKRTRQMCELACSVDVTSLADTPSEFIDKDFLSKINDFRPSIIGCIPDRLIDERIIISCCKNEPEFIRYVNPARFNKGNIISVVFKTKRHIIMYIDDIFKTKELCELACADNGLAIKYVPLKHRSFDLYLTACVSNPQAIEYLPSDMEIEKKTYIYQHVCKADENGLRWIPEEERTFELCKMARITFPYSFDVEYALPEHLTEIEKNELSLLFKGSRNAFSLNNSKNYHLSCYKELLKCIPADDSPEEANEKLAISLITDPFTAIAFVPKRIQYKLLMCPQVTVDEKKKLVDFINHGEKHLPTTKKNITTYESPSKFSVDNDLLYDLVSNAHEFNFQPPNFQAGLHLVDCISNESTCFQQRTLGEYLENASYAMRGGRTLLVENNTSELLHIKFQRQNEPLEELTREGNIYKALHKNDILKNKFYSEIPKFIEFAKVKVNAQEIENLSKFDDRLAFEKENEDTYINVLVYKATREYTKYAHILNDNVSIPEQGILKACSDIGLLASMGIVLDSILPAFHDSESNRRWVAFFSAFCLNRGFVHPGTFGAWNTSATEKCDIGYTGIRDIGDHEIFGKIKTCLNQKNTSEAMFPDKVNQRIGFCNTVCEALIAVILVRSRLYQQTNEYHYRNAKSLCDTAQFINDMGNAFCNSFYSTSSPLAFQNLLEMNGHEYQKWLQRTALEIVYWTAKQPTFDELASNHTDDDCYLSHIKNNHLLHPDIYPHLGDAAMYKHYFNPEKKLNLGRNNSTFPLLSLISGLTLMSVNLLSRA